MGSLPSLEINLSCLDSDSDGLCNGVETNTETYNNPDDTGTDPNNPDGDNFSNVEELQCESNPTDSNSKGKRVLPFMMLLLD